MKSLIWTEFVIITLERWFMIEKPPESKYISVSSVDGAPSGLFSLSYSPGRRRPGNWVEPSPRRKGECWQGSRTRWARRWELWRILHWIMENVDLFKAKTPITYWSWSWNKYQVIGLKGHQHRECIAVTTWPPTPNMPPPGTGSLHYLP